MKVQQSIIDFTGMQFKTERSMNQRFAGRARVGRSARSQKHLTRNVRGVFGGLFGVN